MIRSNRGRVCVAHKGYSGQSQARQKTSCLSTCGIQLERRACPDLPAIPITQGERPTIKKRVPPAGFIYDDSNNTTNPQTEAAWRPPMRVNVIARQPNRKLSSRSCSALSLHCCLLPSGCSPSHRGSQVYMAGSCTTAVTMQ